MMKIAIAFIVALLAATLLTASPAAADDSPGASGDRTLDLDLKIGADGFRLGGRMLGLERVLGAWINGQRTDRGFVLDGRLQTDERNYNFRFNADVLDALKPAADALKPAVKWWSTEGL